MTKDTKRLTKGELDKLKPVLEGLEAEVYYSGGYSKISGGFSACDMKDYDDDYIYAELSFGVQSDVENTRTVEDITIDRKTMEVED